MIQQNRILNFNFKTKVLFKCISTKYAKDFVRGKIKFSQPRIWVDIAKNGNNRQGDLREGVFIACQKDDKSPLIKSLLLNNNMESFVDNDLRYFRNKLTLNNYCFCAYGLHDNAFVREETDRFNKKHYIATVKKEYFDDFLDDNQKETNSVIFILNPHEFFERIKNFFKKYDINDNSIIISPIEYIDINKPFVSLLSPPLELLTKNLSYNNQSEVRIIINSNKKELLDYMKNNNGVIDIGDISDISILHDNYNNDLLIEIDDNVLKYNLPHPEIIALEDFTPNDLINTYKTIIDDKLPSKMNEQDELELLKEIERILVNKYGIEIDKNFK